MRVSGVSLEKNVCVFFTETHTVVLFGNFLMDFTARVTTAVQFDFQGGEKGGCLVNNYLAKRGEERWIKLVLKSIADVGLVG